MAAPRPPAAGAGGRRRARGVGLLLHDRSGDARAGDFGEQAHLVVPPSGPRHRALPEIGVGGIEDDPGLAFGFQRGGLRLSEDAIEAIDQRVHIGIDGVGGRHGEDARAAGALLVFVQPDGGEPFVPEHLGGHLAFLLAEEVHVAVVIVAGVVVIEERQRTGFAGRAEGLVVPVGDHDLAVGIERRDQQEDHVVEHLFDGGGIAGGEVVDQFQHHLRRADFGGVDVVGDEDDGLAVAEDLVALGLGGGAALEVELAFQVLQLVEIAQVLGGADFQQDERIAVGGRAEIAELDAVGAIGDEPACTRRSCPSGPVFYRCRCGSRNTARGVCTAAVAVRATERETEIRRRVLMGQRSCRWSFRPEMNNCREIGGWMSTGTLIVR